MSSLRQAFFFRIFVAHCLQPKKKPRRFKVNFGRLCEVQLDRLALSGSPNVPKSEFFFWEWEILRWNCGSDWFTQEIEKKPTISANPLPPPSFPNLAPVSCLLIRDKASPLYSGVSNVWSALCVAFVAFQAQKHASAWLLPTEVVPVCPPPRLKKKFGSPRKLTFDAFIALCLSAVHLLLTFSSKSTPSVMLSV